VGREVGHASVKALVVQFELSHSDLGVQGFHYRL
jgi:hypothetical protein